MFLHCSCKGVRNQFAERSSRSSSGRIPVGDVLSVSSVQPPSPSRFISLVFVELKGSGYIPGPIYLVVDLKVGILAEKTLDVSNGGEIMHTKRVSCCLGWHY